MFQSTARILFSVVLTLSLVAIPAYGQPAAPHTCAGLFISEYVEGSSNNKALELFNGTGAAIDLAAEGYRFEFYFNGSAAPGAIIPLTGTIANGGVYVLADNNAAPAILAVANQTDPANFFNGNDAVALRRGSALLDVIGQVGLDPGSAWGSGMTSTLDHTLRRKAAVSASDANPNDPFEPALKWVGYARDTFAGLGAHTATCSYLPSAPSSGAANACPPPEPGACGDPATLIHAIQGSGAVSPLVGMVQVVEAQVVGDFQDPVTGLAGFFLQEEFDQIDDDWTTSEGLFIYDNGFGVDVALGDLVRVRGTVSEYQGLTQLAAVDHVQRCGQLPWVWGVAISLPVSNAGVWETIEGMQVGFAHELTVAEVYNLGRYGEVTLTRDDRPMQFTQTNAPGVAGYAAYLADLALRTVILDDGNAQENRDPIAYPAPGLSAANTLRVGDTLTNLTAVVDQRFGSYRLQPAVAPQFAASNPRPAPPTGAGLKVMSFNVLNYFNGDGQGGGFPTPRGASTPSEFARQRAKIISVLAGVQADVVGLIEVENDAGPLSAQADLVAGLNASLGASAYAMIDTGVLGGDQIKVAFVYRPAAVTPVGSWLTDSDAVWSRVPLAQVFQDNATGERFTVVVNHFKSKGCDGATGADRDQNDGQGCYNARRVLQAQRLAQWVTDAVIPAAGDPDVLLIGDYNAYAMEDPIAVLAAAGYSNLSPASDYSYVFAGQSGTLDYALASASLAPQVAGAEVWHINADEPRVLDYNEEFKSPGQLVSLYSPDAYRSSDHDPLLVRLQFAQTRSLWLPIVEVER